MKKIIVLIIFSSLLSACVTSTTKQSSQKNQAKPAYPNYNIPRNVDKIIKGLEGCKKEFVFEVMGLPDDEKIIDEKKYFYWTLNGSSTGFWAGDTNSHHCTIHAQVNDDGIINQIFYTSLRNGCKYRYVQIVRYYRTHPAQSPETCPNRTDLQGNHSIKK